MEAPKVEIAQRTAFTIYYADQNAYKMRERGRIEAYFRCRKNFEGRCCSETNGLMRRDAGMLIYSELVILVLFRATILLGGQIWTRDGHFMSGQQKPGQRGKT